MRNQKLKNNPTYQSASGCADPKIAVHLPRRPVNLFYQNKKNIYNIFHSEVSSELEKNGSAVFHSRRRMKVELIRENSRNTYNTGSKGYV